MLTTISKCLAVFTVVASLLFLGIAVITTAAGPNWAGDVEELPEFTFTKTVAETGTTWGAKSRSDEGFSKTGIMPEVIVAARKKLKDDQDDRIKLLDQQIEAETLRLSSAKQLIAVDIDAIDPSYAPGTGTPEIGGFTSYEAQRIVRKLAGLNLIGADLVEVSPPFDQTGGTGGVGVSIMFELLCVLATATEKAA